MVNRITVLLLATAMLTIGAGSTLMLNLLRFQDSLHWVQRTNEVLHHLSSAEVGLFQAESGERGWILSGDVSYFVAYRRAAELVAGSLRALDSLVAADSDEQRLLLDTLRVLIDARLGAISQAVELGADRRDDALAILASERDRGLVPLIMKKLGRMRQVQTDLRAEREMSVNRAAANTTAAVTGMALLALIGTLFGAYLLQKQRTLVQLRSTKTYLEAVLATVPDAMIVCDRAGIIASFGASAERMFRMTAEEARGRTISSLFPEPVDRELHDFIVQFQARSHHPHFATREVLAHRSDGNVFPVELYIGDLLVDGSNRFVAFLHDLVEQKARERRAEELQSELLHVSRLNNMGEMASALAHEINQPLTALSAYLQGARRLLTQIEDAKNPAIRQAMEKAIAQAHRAGNVIRRLREFVSRGETEVHFESLKAMVQEAFALAVVAEDKPVSFVLALDPTVDLVMVNKIQIQQVLLNLIRNGLEAMTETPRRQLLIASMRASKGLVEVSVSDTGSGIAPEVADKLFQSFTSTKKRGLGVGLSISRTIVEAHGGRILAEPNPGGGTVFRFTLRSAFLEDDGADESPASEPR